MQPINPRQDGEPRCATLGFRFRTACAVLALFALANVAVASAAASLPSTAPISAAEVSRHESPQTGAALLLPVVEIAPRGMQHVASAAIGSWQLDGSDGDAHSRPVNAAPGFVGTQHSIISAMVMLLSFIVLIMMVYALRHVLFTLNRLFGRQRHPYIDIDNAQWPKITVFIAAHNEEKVIAGCMDALFNSNYPIDCLTIVPVNDRSTDDTRAIIDDYIRRYPGRITAFHRSGGKAGKAAALKDALVYAEGDIAIIFDADYVPGRGLLKQLVAPFFDPEVGAVMGRVVPMNVASNLLTRMLDLERSGGYQVDQQARMNLKLVPQYGGTVGGVRLSAVAAVGGWHDDVLAEDTDITYRLLFNGWKTIYTNRTECYEEVPEEWEVRIKQVKRWSKGHNQVLARYWYRFATSPFLSVRERIDGMLLLLVFVIPPLLLVGWLLALGLYFMNADAAVTTLIPAFALMAYCTMGNFAAFFEIVVAVLLDGNRRRLRLLPFNLLGFFVSLFSISSSIVSLALDFTLKRDLVWEKTARYRKAGTK